MITIFTPAYNRAHLLPRLYESLEAQSCKDFEWVVVDDGSKDNTREVVEGYASLASFSVRYFRQENGGKHRAVNRGVKEAKGELFFIVDSDDVLVDNAIERINYHYDVIKNNDSFAGVCGLKAYFNGEKVGGEQNFDVLDCNALDFRYKYKIVGDMSEVFKTSVMRQFPFPEYEGERFCPEAVVFNRIASRYKLRYFYEKIYLCEYLPDGLTAQIVKVRMKSPCASMDCYQEMTKLKIPTLIRLRAAINYWRFSACSPLSFNNKCKGMKKWLWLWPFGYAMHFNDTRL